MGQQQSLNIFASSHSPAEPPGGLGVGARGAGAGERGLKASQALQRPTRAQARILERIAISLIQGVFLTQGSNLHLLYQQVGSLPLSNQESPSTEKNHH